MTSTGSPRRVPLGRVKLVSAWFILWAVVYWLLTVVVCKRLQESCTRQGAKT